jgi:hypothetical protein
MPRYIDRQQIEDYLKINADILFKSNFEIKEFLNKLYSMPIADVVPRSEVEEIVKFKDMAYAELKSLFIEAKREVESMVTEAKRQVQSYVDNKIYSTGLQMLKDGFESPQLIENKKDESEGTENE